MKSLSSFIFFISLVCMMSSCSDKAYHLDQSTVLIDSTNKFKTAATAGNLIATAMREVHNLDVVLYPSEFLQDGAMALLKDEMDDFEKEELLNLYPNGRKDSFILGRMSGRQIKDFIQRRAQRTSRADLQVAGINYDISLLGGTLEHAYVVGDRRIVFNDRDYYRVAVSYYKYDHRQNFPGYFFGDNLSYSFNSINKFISAKESLKKFLNGTYQGFNFIYPRANFRNQILSYLGYRPIYEIQSNMHFTPLRGHTVTTKGIVTAYGKNDRGTVGTDVYIQDPKGDGRLETSDALHLFFPKDVELELGDEVEVSGLIIEQVTNTNMSRTSLTNISNLKVLSRNNPLPKAEKLGKGGRPIPDKVVSSWRGDLNRKPFLKVSDGIDFWESLEGMRVSLNDLRVLGFRGGREEVEAQRPKDYLNLYVVADGQEPKEGTTRVNGLMIDPLAGDFNPEVVQLQANHLSKGFSTSTYFNVGDLIKGNVEGVLTYEMNIFGAGEWAIVLPEPQKAIETDFNSDGLFPLENRPVTTLESLNENELTVATYNVENLAGNQDTRLKDTARIISINLKCPDIMNLVEIQDNNGIDFTGGSSADVTLEKIVSYLDCPGKDYRIVNKDPLNHNEGGQPGGNIRVSMIYDANRLSFNLIPSSNPLLHTTVDNNGNLSINPGRVFPRSEEFKRTRKSIVAQFEFRGKPIFIIGNHFNSKLGDSSAWSNWQPVFFGSEQKRNDLARMVNKFVQIIERQNPDAHIAVMGDFNAYIVEDSMRILAGREMKNLMTYQNLIPPHMRYTTNFNGSSQAIDFIFANKNFLQRNPQHEVLHVNSDYMGRYSDHDPLVAKFSF